MEYYRGDIGSTSEKIDNIIGSNTLSVHNGKKVTIKQEVIVWSYPCSGKVVCRIDKYCPAGLLKGSDEQVYTVYVKASEVGNTMNVYPY